jgi:hypothetical protein
MGEVEVLISKAPDDPDDKKAWVNEMVRIQVALWVDERNGIFCAQCGKRYESVDDFLARNPMGGMPPDRFVDRDCWPEYLKLHPLPQEV